MVCWCVYSLSYLFFFVLFAPIPSILFRRTTTTIPFKKSPHKTLNYLNDIRFINHHGHKKTILPLLYFYGIDNFCFFSNPGNLKNENKQTNKKTRENKVLFPILLWKWTNRSPQTTIKNSKRKFFPFLKTFF